MSTLRRFLIWFLLAFAAIFGAGAIGYFIRASGQKVYILWGLEIALDLAIAWLLGLLRFRTSGETTTAILVVVLALAMRPIFMVLAIISTVFCGIDACGH
jgi:hypothetical protein